MVREARSIFVRAVTPCGSGPAAASLLGAAPSASEGQFTARVEMTYDGYTRPRKQSGFGNGASSRIARTLANLHTGALPAPTMAVRAFMAGGTGAECSGCGETINGLENAYPQEPGRVPGEAEGGR